MRSRLVTVVAVLAVSVFALVGCSTQARAERKGKQAAEETCKAKDASNANDAKRHLDRANGSLNDLARFTGRDVRQDVRDLDRNLNQLARGNGSTQTVNAIVRNVQDARGSVDGNAAAAYDGMLEGLAECD